MSGPSELRDKQAGFGDITSSKGWLPLDYPSMTRALIVAGSLAFVNARFLAPKDASFLDPENALLIPLVLASEKTEDYIYRNYDRTRFSQPLIVGAGAFLISYFAASQSVGGAAEYALAASALTVVATQLTTGHVISRLI